MENIEKIEIKPNEFVWVDKDAEIKEGDWFLNLLQKEIYNHNIKNYDVSKSYLCKIIAASPSLNLEGVPNYVEWLANKFVEAKKFRSEQKDKTRLYSFIQGYQTAEKEYEEQSRSFEDSTELFPFDASTLLKAAGFIKGYQTAEKELPTWDDIRKAIDFIPYHLEYGNLIGRKSDKEIEEFIEQLKQSKNEK